MLQNIKRLMPEKRFVHLVITKSLLLREASKVQLLWSHGNGNDYEIKKSKWNSKKREATVAFIHS